MTAELIWRSFADRADKSNDICKQLRLLVGDRFKVTKNPSQVPEFSATRKTYTQTMTGIAPVENATLRHFTLTRVSPSSSQSKSSL